MGRCRAERLQQTFGHPWAASYLISPLLLKHTQARYFRGALNQQVPSTGMTALAFAETMCDSISLYGFANGSCPSACYHGSKVAVLAVPQLATTGSLDCI